MIGEKWGAREVPTGRQVRMARGWKRLATVAGGSGAGLLLVLGLMDGIGTGYTLTQWLVLWAASALVALFLWGAVRAIGWIADGFTT